MICEYMILAAAVWGQTSQPAGPPPALRARRMSVVPPTTQPARTAALRSPERAGPGPRPATQPAGAVRVIPFAEIDNLSGSTVDVDAVGPDSILITGDQADLDLLEKLIKAMDEEQPAPMTFRVFPLKHAQAAELAREMERGWNEAKGHRPGGIRPEDRITIIPEARSNRLMVAASEQSMLEVESLLEGFDVPAIDKKTMIFTPVLLKHINAAEAEQLVKDMLEDLQKQRGIQRPLVNLRADVRSNTLFISAPEEDLNQIKVLIEMIDVEPTAGSWAVVKLAVYPLQRAVARDLAEALNEMLQTQAQTDQAKAMKEQIRRLQVLLKKRDGAARPVADLDLDKPIKVFPEPGTNSIIVATAETNLEPIGELIKLLDSVPLADEMMIRVYPLNHADAETLLASLRDIFEQGERLAEQPGKRVEGRVPPGIVGSVAYNIGLALDKRTNTIIASGRAEQLMVIEQVIKAVDVEDSATKFPPQLVHMEHADVKQIADILQKLADQRQQLSEKMGATAAERERILVIPDVRTNSLILVAKEDNFKEFKTLALDLDGADQEYLGQIRILRLENLAAADLAPKIEDLWQRRADLRRQSGLPEDRPVIVTDARSNALVIASNPEDYEAIVRIVAELEKQPRSPMHEIRHVILKHNDATKLVDVLQRLFEERLKQTLGEGQKEQPSDRVFIVAEPLTNMLLITSTQSNFEEVSRLVSQLDVPLALGAVFRTFYVRHQDVGKAAELLTELFDKGIYRGPQGDREIPDSEKNITVVTDLRSSALIVSGSPTNLEIVAQLIEEIDRADTPILAAETRFFKIEQADVVNLADTLDQMFEGMRKAVPSDQQDQFELTVIPSVRSNTLVVAGARYAMKRVEELVPQLDRPPGEATAEVKIYPLKEASAAKLAGVLTKLFEERAPQDQGGKRTPVTVLADDQSNSLVVIASRDDHAMVDHWRELLDRKSSLSQQMEIFPLAEAKADQLAETLSDLLEQQGQGADEQPRFAVVPEPRTNSVVVFAPPDMMTHIRSVIQKLDNNQVKTPLALRVFRLNNAKAEDLAKLLNDFFTDAGAGQGQEEARQLIIKFTRLDPETGQKLDGSLVHQDVTLMADPYTNSLLVMAPEQQIGMLEGLIAMLDSVEPKTASVQVFYLRNADAEEMQKMLEELFQPKGTGKEGEGRQLIIGGEGGAAGAAGGETGGMLELAFAIDRRTNALIAAGSESYLRNVERLVLQLDVQDIEDRVVRVVRLRHAKATDVAETMRSYFEEESQALEKAEEGVSAQRLLQRQVTIQDAAQEEGESSVLLMSYNPRMESQIVQMINELDQAPPQVMIQVLMAEVTLDDRLELGMEFALQDLLFSEKAFLGPNGTLQGDSFDFIGGTDVGAGGTGALGGLSFTVTGEDFNFLLRALQTEGRLEVLSRPAIMVQDGQEAKFSVGERVPTVQDVVVSGNGTVTPSVTYEPVGIKLDVTPIINPDGYVNLEIIPEISAIGSSSVTIAQGVNLPIFTERKAETSVTVKDGETIIIGGLITSRTNESENKVPLIGDIPGLGNLFRATIHTTTKTELLIILTPHVIRTVEDAHTLSVQMRDQTGLIENIRRSPLMQKLRVTAEEEEAGPLKENVQPAPPPGTGPAKEGDILGPELEKLGPETSTIRVAPQEDVVAVAKE